MIAGQFIDKSQLLLMLEGLIIKPDEELICYQYEMSSALQQAWRKGVKDCCVALQGTVENMNTYSGFVECAR